MASKGKSKERATQTLIKAAGLPVTGATPKEMEAFVDRVRTETNSAWMGYLGYHGSQHLWPVFARHSPTVAVEPGSDTLRRIFLLEIEETIQNPHFDKRAIQMLCDYAIKYMVKWPSLSTDLKRALEKFFTVLPEVGGLEKRHVATLRQRARDMPPVLATDFLVALAGVREAWADKAIMEAISAMAPHDNPVVRIRQQHQVGLRHLGVSSGKEWAAVAMELEKAQATTGAQAQALGRIAPPVPWDDLVEEYIEALGKARSWNLEGVKREDVLFLVASSDARLRQEGTKLMKRLSGERRTGNPKKAPGAFRSTR